MLTLDDDDGPLYLRLYRRLRGLILDGSWETGTKLPSSRTLSEELGVSRNTALHALEMLIADGLVQARQGSAIYVTAAAPKPTDLDRHPSLSRHRKPVPFEVGWHTAEFFPLDKWDRLQSKIPAEARSASLYGSGPGGWPELRQAIASYAGAARGLSVSADQVVIVSNTQSALDLVIRLLAEPNDEIWMEDPGYPIAQDLLRLNQLTLVPVPVDGEGLNVQSGSRQAPAARFAYVTPACQFPTGRVMSAGRRAEILDWASANRAWVIEDDWEWHAHFGKGGAPRPLASLPGGERVLFLQTFNRTIFPALRIAFLIAPPDLAIKLAELSHRIAGEPSVPTQAALAEFLERGLYAAHLRATRAAYAERRSVLLNELRSLPPGFEPHADRAGLHLVIGTPSGVDDSELAADLRSKGIECSGISEFSTGNACERGLILGFAAFTPQQILKPARRLVRHLQALYPHGRR